MVTVKKAAMATAIVGMLGVGLWLAVIMSLPSFKNGPYHCRYIGLHHITCTTHN